MTEQAEPLAVWMNEAEGWKHVPRESAVYEFCAEAAGCDGRVFANTKLPELVLCDGADLVLWKMGDVRDAAELAIREQRTRGVKLALEIATIAAGVTVEAVKQEREDCAKIADEQRELWHGGGGSEGGGGSAVAATIAVAIRKRGEGDLARFAAELGIEVPEDGGAVVDDAGPGGDRPSQPPPGFEERSHRVPAITCLSCGKVLNAATKVEGDAAGPEPGNVSICLQCGHVMAFGDDLTLRELTDEEAHEIAGDPVVLKLQRLRGKVMAAKQEAEPWSQPPASPPDDSEPPSPAPPKND